MEQKGTPPWSSQKGFIILVVQTSSCEHQCPIWLELRNIHLCTYPKWAIGHIGSSPDNRNCMFDWLNWHIGTGKHTIRLALYLDIYRVSFSILKSSNTSSRFRYFKNVCIVWTAQDCSKMCQGFFSPELQLRSTEETSNLHSCKSFSSNTSSFMHHPTTHRKFTGSETLQCFQMTTQGNYTLLCWGDSKQGSKVTYFIHFRALCFQLLPDYITQIKAENFDWITHAQN